MEAALENRGISFESLLPHGALTADQSAFRARLVEILEFQGEILPAAESPLGKLWRLVNSEESSIDDCVKVIALDPALTARVFRVANSAIYEGRVTNLSEAVFFLGLAKIRQVAFNAGIFTQFARLKVPLKWSHFWIRSVFIAGVTERIAAQSFRPDGGEYLAGLLHDTGWLLLAAFFPEELNTLLSGAKPVDEAERESLSFTHADISALLCARSFLPPRVINGISRHPRPRLAKLDPSEMPRSSARFLSVILNVADQLANASDMAIVERNRCTVQEVEESPEALWLGEAGVKIDFQSLVEEELSKAQEIFSIFFINRA